MDLCIVSVYVYIHIHKYQHICVCVYVCNVYTCMYIYVLKVYRKNRIVLKKKGFGCAFASGAFAAAHTSAAPKAA